MVEPPIIVGYSGHAYMVLSAMQSRLVRPIWYVDEAEKSHNPYALKYAGNDGHPRVKELLETHPYFIAIGDNRIRAMVDEKTKGTLGEAVVHAQAIVDPLVEVGPGVFIGPGAVVNPLALLGRGAIVNSRAVVEHECRVGDFAHIAPGATLLGNVSVGPGSLVGGNAVVLPGVTIGSYCTVGAGAVVRQDVPDGVTVVGNPAVTL
ncbi:MAG: acetyltransferase [Bacteroidota bacterium]